jgi:predicted ATPase/DNA-binding SARP family transcriptional activator
MTGMLASTEHCVGGSSACAGRYDPGVGSNGLRFEALGALRVVNDIEVAITRPARRRILSILLLDRGRVVTVPQLIDRMWGDRPPGEPRNTLQAHVAGLRRQLGHVIESTSAGYRIDVTAHWFDVEEFENRALQVEQTPVDDEVVVDSAAEALRLWRGDPFPDLAGDDYARGAVGALVETRRRVEMRRLDALLAAGRAEEALPDLERLVSDQPYEERFWELLILAKYRIGNAAGALRAFQTVRTLLGEELGIEPGTRLRDLEERILLQDPSLGSQPGAATPHNLPASTSSFVGRRPDVAGVSGLLRNHRLVTVTGGPGLGKTRLAIEVGSGLREAFGGGVWLVRLAGARSEDDVIATIAAATGIVHDVSDAAELGALVSSRPQLVILDNCEHVLDHVRPFVLACLESDGAVHILATSRHRLGLGAEQVWRLAPLELPTAAHAALESDSVRLLVDRAQAVDRSFRLDGVSPDGLIALVKHTDGIPLALELAASWLPSIGVADAIGVAGTPAPDAMADLDDHHRSMRSAVNWSFALLAPPDRPLAAAASVFNGSFVLDGFREVCGPDLSPADAAGAVSRLVESSLLTAERQDDGALRYRMLEPVREYGHEHLVEFGMNGEVHDRHARWYLERAVALGEVVDRETDPAAAQAVIDTELADHRAAMRWLLDAGDHESVATLATALTGFWFARYLGSEAIRWLDEALAGSMSERVRVKALWTAGWAAYSKADYAAATVRYDECRALASAIGDHASEGRALFGLGRIELPRNPERGHRHMRDALEALSVQPARTRDRGDCLVALGITAAMGGRVDEARSFLGDARSIMEECGSLRSLSIIHRYLSLAAWYDDDADAARHHLELAERLARRSDDRPAIGGSLIQRALVEARWGDLARAAGAMLEAMGQLPSRNEIDHCLVFVGAFPVLIGAGHHDMAARLFDHIDRVYADHGWVPADRRMPAAAGFRTTVAASGSPGRFDPVSSSEMAESIRPLLEELVHSPAGVQRSFSPSP